MKTKECSHRGPSRVPPLQTVSLPKLKLLTRLLSTLSSSLSLSISIMTPPATITHEPNPNPNHSPFDGGRYNTNNYHSSHHHRPPPPPASIYSNASFSSSSSTFTISAMPSANQGEEVFVEGLAHSEARLEARLVVLFSLSSSVSHGQLHAGGVPRLLASFVKAMACERGETHT